MRAIKTTQDWRRDLGKKEGKTMKLEALLITDQCYSIRSSLWSSLSPALSTVDWPARVGLEGDFTFLSTSGANCLEHFA